jgi:hypothetical protein
MFQQDTFWNPEWADSLSKSFQFGISNPDESKNFFGACLLKSAHFGGNSSTRLDDVERRLKFE